MKSLIIFICSVAMVMFFALGSFKGADVSDANYSALQRVNKSLVLTQPPTSLPDFSFEKAGKVAFTNESLLGKWTILFVGYTYCPDICPTTLAHLDHVYPKLTNDEKTTTQVVFVSVDPNRDKAEQLADYVNYFNANFIGVTSTHKQLWPFVTQLGLSYSIVEEGDTDDDLYLIDHSASIILINPKGEFHATFKSEVNAQGINNVDMDKMAIDIKDIQDNYNPSSSD